MTPEQAVDKVYTATGVLLGTDKAPHITSYMTVMETRIAELEDKMRQILAMGISPYAFAPPPESPAFAPRLMQFIPSGIGWPPLSRAWLWPQTRYISKEPPCWKQSILFVNEQG